MFTPSPEKLLLLVIVAMVVLGPKKFPGAARSLARNIREMKDGISVKEPEPPAERTPVAAIAPPAPADPPAGPAS